MGAKVNGNFWIWDDSVGYVRICPYIKVWQSILFSETHKHIILTFPLIFAACIPLTQYNETEEFC
jgi:hypothetical protein